MNEIKLKLANLYKVPRVSSNIESDIKQILKINQTFLKMEKYNKDIYILEVFNILKLLDNLFNINDLYIIISSTVEVRFQDTLNFLFEEFENLDQDKIIRKFKDLNFED